MAHFLRLILAVLVMAFSLVAHALIPTVSSWRVDTNAGQTDAFPTKAQACADAYRVRGITYTNGGWLNVKTTDIGTYCHLTGDHPSSPGTHLDSYWSYYGGPAMCPANSTSSGGSCACTAPYVEDATHTSCVLPPTSAEKWKKWCQDAAGQSLGPMEAPGKGAPGGCLSNINIVGSPIDTPGYSPGDVPEGGGCSFAFKDGRSYADGVPEPGKPYKWVTEGEGVVGGGTCMAGDAPIPTDAPPGTEAAPKGDKDPCPSGFQGTVNGTPVCAKHDPTKGVEGTSTGTTKNPDGTSKDVKKDIKCDNGRCTIKTTETTRDANGTITGTSVKEEENTIGEVCNKEPGTKVCAGVGMGNDEGGAGFSGNCVAGFVAKSDDPILNAMALEQHKRNCEVMRTDTEPSTWAAAEGAKTDNAMKDNPNNSAVSIGAGSFDTSDSLGGGGCSLNKTVVVRGYSVALPFNVLCDPLAVLGQILVAVSLLLAARIVTRG